MTVLELLDVTTAYFQKNDLANPRLDAEVLLAHALKTTRLQLYMAFDRILSEEEKNSYRDLVRRRAKGEPVAYLTGTREFWSMPLAVKSGVLIPRPETEILVEAVMKKIPADKPVKILEIATGSGAITAALAVDRPLAQFVVTDISEEALTLCRINFENLGLSSRIQILKHHFLTEPLSGAFDVIVSNPPYIRTKDLATLPRDVRDFEPALALDGGTDGLDFYRKIGQGAPSLLLPGGFLAVEIGEDQAREVSQLFEENHFKKINVIKDYAGHDRVVIATKD